MSAGGGATAALACTHDASGYRSIVTMSTSTTEDGYLANRKLQTYSPFGRVVEIGSREV